MLKRLKNIVLYGDTDRDSYLEIWEKIEASNRITCTLFCSIAAVLILIMIILSFSQKGLSSSRPVYVFGLLFSLIIIATALMSKKYPILSYVAVYMSVSVFLIYGIAIATLTRPNDQTVTFMVLLIFVPLVFVDRPLRMGTALAIFVSVFIVAAKMTKAESVLAEDITDTLIYGVLAIISQTVINRVKIRGYVLENRLQAMSETDLLTGLNNRNCYEHRLKAYADGNWASLCCVYLDGNGLHELNDLKGHQEGDRMLCMIAEAIRDAFGSRDTYRTGGDEYVAFALNQSQAYIDRKIADVRTMVENAGYHVSIGYEYTDSRQSDFDEMIKRAEAKMYQDKAEYYKTHDRRHR